MTNSDLSLSDAAQVPPDSPLGPASPLGGAQGALSTGAHNIHINEPEPGSARLIDTGAATMFSAGLRIYDIRDPFRPEEIAPFLPETPAGQRG